MQCGENIQMCAYRNHESSQSQIIAVSDGWENIIE